MSDLTIQPASYFEAEEKRLRELKTSVIEHHLKEATKGDLERLIKAASDTLFTHVGYGSDQTVKLISISLDIHNAPILFFIDSCMDFFAEVKDLTDSDKTILLKLIEATI